MSQRAVDRDTADNVLVAIELAKSGAASTLIEQVTGFGTRWIRRIVRENGGALARKARDPLRWFDQRAARLLDACLFQGAYELQPESESCGRRLLDAYRAYRRLAAAPAVLDINECAQMVDLCHCGEARVRECMECHEPYLVLADRALCPVCRLIEREFCRGCGRPFLQRDHHWRAYCDACSPRSIRVATRRLHLRIAAPVEESAGSPLIVPPRPGAPL